MDEDEKSTVTISYRAIHQDHCITGGVTKRYLTYSGGKQEPIFTDKDENDWWIAKEVCDILGIINTSQAVNALDDDEKADICNTYISSTGVEQRRNILIVNQSGLYNLIFRSRKPEAKQFKNAGHPLPDIRTSVIQSPFKIQC